LGHKCSMHLTGGEWGGDEYLGGQDHGGGRKRRGGRKRKRETQKNKKGLREKTTTGGGRKGRIEQWCKSPGLQGEQIFKPTTCVSAHQKKRGKKFPKKKSMPGSQGASRTSRGKGCHWGKKKKPKADQTFSRKLKKRFRRGTGRQRNGCLSRNRRKFTGKKGKKSPVKTTPPSKGALLGHRKFCKHAG